MCFFEIFDCGRKRKIYTRDDGVSWEEVDFMIKLQKEEEIRNRKAEKFENKYKLDFLGKATEPINIPKKLF